MSAACLGLGSNLGDRLEYLRRAVALLGSDTDIRITAVSPVYESEAHVLPDQPPSPDFLNAVVSVETCLSPPDLLDRCLRIEHSLGRERHNSRWLPRRIDIDILLFDDTSYSDHRLTVPHPRLHERRFVLQPLSDLDPNAWIPEPHGTTVNRLLLDCGDETRLSMHSVDGIGLLPEAGSLSSPSAIL